MRRAGLVLASLLVLGCPPAPPPAVAPPPPTPTPVPMREVPPRLGVALGGGGARGFAQIGVLRVLEQEKLPIAVVAGTSVGSLIGALYSDTGSVLAAEFLAVAVKEEDLFDSHALSFFSGGLVKGERLERFLTTNLKSRTIEAMKVPFAAVATNLRNGETVVFQRGPVAPAVHASSAIPGVFVPVEIAGQTYVDGGVTDPVPSDVARRMGAEVVLAVAIPSRITPIAPKNPIEVAYQAAMIMASELGRLRARDADVVVEPDVGDVAYDDFSQKKRLVEAGEAAMRRALPRLRDALAARTRRVPAGPG